MNLQITWLVDGDNYLISPVGTKVARITEGILWLHDKRLKTSLPFTQDDWATLMNKSQPSVTTDNANRSLGD